MAAGVANLETFRITNRSEINGVHGLRTMSIEQLTLRFLSFILYLKRTSNRVMDGPERVHDGSLSFDGIDRRLIDPRVSFRQIENGTSERVVFLLLLFFRFFLEKVDSLDASLFRAWYFLFFVDLIFEIRIGELSKMCSSDMYINFSLYISFESENIKISKLKRKKRYKRS